MYIYIFLIYYYIIYTSLCNVIYWLHSITFSSDYIVKRVFNLKDSKKTRNNFFTSIKNIKIYRININAFIFNIKFLLQKIILRKKKKN